MSWADFAKSSDVMSASVHAAPYRSSPLIGLFASQKSSMSLAKATLSHLTGAVHLSHSEYRTLKVLRKIRFLTSLAGIKNTLFRLRSDAVKEITLSRAPR